MASTQKGSSVHTELARLAGEWQGSVRTWFEAGQLADEQPVRGTMKLALDGRFVVHEYETTLSGHPCLGLALYGYDANSDRYQSAWIDSCHNDMAIMFSEGDGGEGKYSVLGYYRVPDQPNWGWRTEIDLVDDENVVITSFNISPQGDEAKAVELQYRRVA